MVSKRKEKSVQNYAQIHNIDQYSLHIIESL